MRQLVYWVPIWVLALASGLLTSKACLNIGMLYRWLFLERYPSAYWWCYWIGFTLLDIIWVCICLSLMVVIYHVIQERRKEEANGDPGLG